MHVREKEGRERREEEEVELGEGEDCLAASSDVSQTAVKRLEHGKHTRSQKREEVTPVEFWKQTLPRKLNLKQNREKVEKQFKFYIEPS